MEASSLSGFKHADQLIFGFTLPDRDSKSWQHIGSFNPTMKVISTVLRWKIPSTSPKEDPDGTTVSDTSQVAPLISPCFSVGENTFPSNWRIHVLTNHCENEEKTLSIFLEFYEYLQKDQHPPSKMNAIYILRLLDPSGNVLISRRSGIRYFNTERLCYGWKPFVSLKSVQSLLESGELRVEVDLTILRSQKLDERGRGCDSVETPKDPEEQPLEEMEDLFQDLSLESSKTEDIEWIPIICNNVEIGVGNKKMLLSKSGYFRKHWKNLVDTHCGNPVLRIRLPNPEILKNIIIFLNGNVKDCTPLHSKNHDSLEKLFLRGIAFQIPSLVNASFNAMCQLAATTRKVDQALTLAIWAKTHALHEIEECQRSMTLLRKYLLKHAMELKYSAVMKANQDHAGWIAECLIAAD